MPEHLFTKYCANSMENNSKVHDGLLKILSECDEYLSSESNLSTEHGAKFRKYSKSKCQFCYKDYLSSGSLSKHEKHCSKNENAKAKKNISGMHDCMVKDIY